MRRLIPSGECCAEARALAGEFRPPALLRLAAKLME
jgi:hypothetical protein